MFEKPRDIYSDTPVGVTPVSSEHASGRWRAFVAGAGYFAAAALPFGIMFAALAMLRHTAQSPDARSIRLSRRITVSTSPRRTPPPPEKPLTPLSPHKPKLRPITRRRKPTPSRPTPRPRVSPALKHIPRIRVPQSVGDSDSLTWVIAPPDALFDADPGVLSGPDGSNNTPAAGRRPAIRSLSDVDSPPELRVYVKPHYPRLARRKRIEGVVRIEFTITAAGTVTDIRLVDPTVPEILADAAIRAASRWRFKPARVDGHPVAVRRIQAIRFELKD